MDWEKYWDQVGENNHSFATQVQRNDEDSIQSSVDNIIARLEISKTDKVLDVCCGNGFITHEISKVCNEIVGVDQSQNLIQIANNTYQENNTKHICISATSMSNDLGSTKFDKIYLEFSFQYFDKKNEGKKVIQEMINLLTPTGKILISNITESGKQKVLFDTLPKRFYYLTSRIRGKNSMGKFWLVKELDDICKELKIQGQYIKQPSHLPYAHYRFDYIITK